MMIGLQLPPIRFLERHDPQARTAQELMELAKTLAEEEFRKHRELMPTFMFDNPPGRFTSAMQIGWSNNQEKHAVANCIRKTLEIIGTTRYAVIVEMWFASEEMDPGRKALPDLSKIVMPSKRPDRKEGISIVVHDVALDEPLFFMFEIVRRVNSRPILRPFEKNGLGQFVDMTFGKLYPTKN